MRDLAALSGTGLFFLPFIYFPFYLFIERFFSHYALIQNLLKVFTVLGGFFLIIYAFSIPMDLLVFMPSRGASKNYVPISIFLVIVGVAIMALPFYSKYLKFSNRNQR